jgi:hypothetical protein
MSTITSLQALDFERRLNALENNVGITIARKRNNENNNKSNNNNKFESIDDRMAKIKLDLERKFARAASEATGTSPSTGNTIGNNTLNSAVVHQRQQSQQSWKEIQKLLRDLDPGIALTHQQQPLLYKRQQVLAVSDELANDFSELDGILKLLMSGTRVDGAADARGGGGDAAPHTSRKIPKGGGPTSSSSSSSSPQKSKQQQQQQQAKKDLEQKLKQQQQPPYDTTTVASHRSSGDTLRLDQVLRAPILTPAAQPPAEQKRVADLQHVLRGLGERTDALRARLRHFLECYHVATMAVSEKIVLADERITAFAANANAK